MEYDDRPLPSQVLPEFDVDPNPVLTQFYRNKIQHYIGHPPPFTKEELMRASKIMFDVRHPEANPLLFRSIVGPAGITKKGYSKDFKDKKNHYLAFQRALVSLEPLPLQVAAPIAAPPLQRVQSYPPASASFMPYSLLARSSAMPSSAMPSSAMPSSAMPSRDLDDRIRELQVKITQAPLSSIRKNIYQVQLAELLRQQREQQQQQQQQQQQDNGGGKKYKKQSYKKRSTKKKQSTKKRSYKKRSKSIKRKAGGGRLPVFQQLAQGQGVSQDTDPDFWRCKGMVDRTSRERQRFQQETAWSGEDTDTE
jgi:hypothetical protein